MTQPLTPQATAIVKQAIANIRSKPDQFDMEHWIGRNGAPKSIRTCGKSACLAGHIVLAAGLRVKDNDGEGSVKASTLEKKLGIIVSSYDGNVDVSDTAEAILGRSGNEIFHSGNWPFPLNEEYQTLTYRFNKDGDQEYRPVTKTLLRKRAALAIKVLKSLLPATKKRKKS